MYSDPKRWSYLFESYVLLTMMEVHHRPQVSLKPLIKHGLIVFSDFLFS